MEVPTWIMNRIRVPNLYPFLTGFLFWTASCSYGVASVRIRHFRIPEPLERASTEPILLDCDYEYDPIDRDSLTVKWFYNDNHEAVYQWIPKTHSPQALGILSGRLDLSYRASEDVYTMHRALRIVNPSMELSGLYRCQVSSFQNEDEKTDYLIIYSKAEVVEINFTKPTPDRVNVSCQAMGLYPEPDTKLIVYSGNTNRVIQEASVVASESDDGSYHVTVHHQFEDRHLEPETKFECVFSIQNAGYAATDYITYSPGPPQSSSTENRHRPSHNPYSSNLALDRQNEWNSSHSQHGQQELAQRGPGRSEAGDKSSSGPPKVPHITSLASLITLTCICWYFLSAGYG